MDNRIDHLPMEHATKRLTGISLRDTNFTITDSRLDD